MFTKLAEKTPARQTGGYKTGLPVAIYPMAMFLGVLVFGVGCGPDHPAGRKLAEEYCGRCHLPPRPGDLPARDWPLILESMATFVGRKPDPSRLRKGQDLLWQNAPLSKPQKALLDDRQWRQLYQYFRAPSPSLDADQPSEKRLNISGSLPVQWKSSDLSGREVMVTSLRYLPERRELLVGNALAPEILALKHPGKITRRVPLDCIPVDIQPVSEQRTAPKSKRNVDYFLVTCPRDIRPHDRKTGKVLLLTLPRPPDRPVTLRILLSQLRRPVGLTVFPNPGESAVTPGRGFRLAVASFGNYRGDLRMLEIKAPLTDPGVGRPVILSRQPGYLTVKWYPGKGPELPPGLLALRAQARETLEFFPLRITPETVTTIEKSEGAESGLRKIKPVILLERRPGWGYTGMELTDQGLFLWNGDNGDIPGQPFKKFHGLRFFGRQSLENSIGAALNSRKLWSRIRRFFAEDPAPLRPEWFAPQPGIYSMHTGGRKSPGEEAAKPESEDGQNILALSWLPERDRPVLSAIQIPEDNGPGKRSLQIQGSVKLTRSRIALGGQNPRGWLRVTTGDWDGDGQPEVFLGAADPGDFTKIEKAERPALLIGKRKSKK